MASANKGLSQSGSKNSSMSSGSFGQNIWATQVPALQAMWNSALGQFNKANQRYGNQMTIANKHNQGIMGQAAQGLQGQLGGGAYKDIDANKLQDQIYSSMQQPTNMQEINNMIMGGKGNNYADAMKSQYVQDANIATQNMLNNLDARASVAGMPGSSRQGIAAAQGINDINRNLQRNLAETGYNTFDKDLDRKLGIASQADQANLARQGMLGDMLAGKQGAMSGGMQMAPGIGGMGQMGVDNAAGMMGLLQGLKGVIGDPTTLNYGSQSGASQGRSNAFGMSGGASVCYITTAVTSALGEPDDGPTLTKLRMFRDEFMLTDPELAKEVGHYYDIAPSIVERINLRPDSKSVWEYINNQYLQPAVEAIDEGDNEDAYNIYSDMVTYCQELLEE